MRRAASLLAFSSTAMRRIYALLQRHLSLLNDCGPRHPREVEPVVDWRRELHCLRTVVLIAGWMLFREQ